MKNSVLKIFYFLNVLNYQGKHFLIFFDTSKAIRARRSKMDPKIDTFGHIDTRVLAILEVKKVVFWTFSKLFWSCLVSVWALFLVFNGKF